MGNTFFSFRTRAKRVYACASEPFNARYDLLNTRSTGKNRSAHETDDNFPEYRKKRKKNARLVKSPMDSVSPRRAILC